MANLAGRPWTFTSADAGTTIWWPTWFKISRMTWSNQNAAGDALVIKDRNGIVRFTSAADVSKAMQDFGGSWMNGLIIGTLASGNLSIWVE